MADNTKYMDVYEATGQRVFTELSDYLTPFDAGHADKAFAAMPADLQERVCRDLAASAGLDDRHTALVLGSTPEMAGALRKLIREMEEAKSAGDA